MPADRGNIRYFLPKWETSLLVDVITQVGEAMRANERAAGDKLIAEFEDGRLGPVEFFELALDAGLGLAEVALVLDGARYADSSGAETEAGR